MNGSFSHQDGFAAFDNDFHSKGPPPVPPMLSNPSMGNNVSEEFRFSPQRKQKRGEIAVPALDRKGTKQSSENPLLMVPDPMAQQRNDEDFFADMPAPKGMSDDPFSDPAFHASGRFSDEGSMDEGDFSDDGTILWEEGGVIVPKAEKYNGHRSMTNFSSSGSHLNYSYGDMKYNTSTKASRKSPPSSTPAGRKRLDGLERRNRASNDDDLTTATPSTRFSTDSEYSTGCSSREIEPAMTTISRLLHPVPDSVPTVNTVLPPLDLKRVPHPAWNSRLDPFSMI